MAEDRETRVIEEQQGEEAEDELYAVVPGSRRGPTASLASVRGDDEAPFHKIEFIHDVPLRLSVEIGQTTLSVKDILGLNVGSVVEFSKVVGEPMDITISGRLMARGEVVVVNERYGVRISEVTRPDEAGAISSLDR